MKPRLLCSDRRGFCIVKVIYKTFYRNHNYGEYFIISLKKGPSPKRVNIFIRSYPVDLFRLAFNCLFSTNTRYRVRFNKYFQLNKMSRSLALFVPYH